MRGDEAGVFRGAYIEYVPQTARRSQRSRWGLLGEFFYM